MTLRANNIEKNFNGVHALKGVTVEFNNSGITAIIGPNGAGKTTLINALTGFENVDSGRTFMGSIEITKLPPDHIARLGLTRTFQEIRLVWRETVLENVMVAIRSPTERLWRTIMGIGVHEQNEEIQAKALKVLRMVGLESKARALATDISYGQQKLLSLARCIATDAQWLILDEPVSGVSPKIINSILETLRKLSKTGKAIVLIEHDINAVRAVADNVVVLDQGQVVMTGTSAEVLSCDEVLEAYLG